MLRRYEPEIHEIQPSLPNNHESVLRFRSEAVSIATAIPFKKVRVTKQIAWNNGRTHYIAPPFANNMYSLKVTGKVLDRSIMNLDAVDRWIAPPDFIEQLARGLNIHYDSSFDIINLEEKGIKISTIPMPLLWRMIEHVPEKELAQFEARPVWNVVVDIITPEVEVYQTEYFPEHGVPPYRATLTGSRFVLEYMQPPENYVEDIHNAMLAFGIAGYIIGDEPRIHKMEYGKLVPVPDHLRHQIMREATERFQCFSLGRFSTWRQILLDDVVKDVKVIEQLIDADPYTRALVESK